MHNFFNFRRLRVGPNRWRFLQESLKSLDQNLRKLNTQLYVVRGDYKDVFPRLFKEWNVDLLTFEHDIEPYSLQRDTFVLRLAVEHGIDVGQEYSHTIYNPELILKKNGGSPPMTYQKFQSVASQLPFPSLAANPQKLPDACHPELDKKELTDKDCYDVPSLEELGVEEAYSKFPGGETEALRRMEMNLKRTKWICAFEKPNTSPNSLEPSTTVLSPYLKFGCLSSRLFYQRIKDVYKGSKHSQPPVSLEGQLIWREFYYTVAAATTNFDRMVGNKVCAQIPWENNETHLEAWTHARTGFPFIDAIMRQLRQEGWIHHLARHAVACFLTRGDLWCHWEEGQKVFEELLLDADWALNAGNWMWLSASAFFHQYYRVYSPIAFGKKTDPEGSFIKKYIPELAKYPKQFIYEPWKAPIESQKKFGCVIGKDYPQPVVDHDVAMKANLVRMKSAYAKKNSGKDDGKRKVDESLKAGTSKKAATARK